MVGGLTNHGRWTVPPWSVDCSTMVGALPYHGRCVDVPWQVRRRTEVYLTSDRGKKDVQQQSVGRPPINTSVQNTISFPFLHSGNDGTANEESRTSDLSRQEVRRFPVRCPASARRTFPCVLICSPYCIEFEFDLWDKCMNKMHNRCGSCRL